MKYLIPSLILALIQTLSVPVSGADLADALGGEKTTSNEIVTVRPPSEVISRQGLPNFVGISRDTAGSTGISMNLVRIPPGGAAKPHVHRHYETAVYLLEGNVETRYGDGLHKSIVNRKGDFIYIPPNVPHQPRNLSQTEPATAIVARNDPNEQENVVPYDPPHPTK